jgi:hypothetical protein
VERQLRREAGYGCCACGLPIYEYHHIVPYHEDDPYPPTEMMLLCPIHHDQATKGALPESEQWELKRHPHNITHGLAGGQLTVNQPYCAVAIGQSLMVGDMAFVVANGEPLLSLSSAQDNGQLELAVTLYDESDALLALIDRNEWVTGDPFPWDIESDFQYLRIRRKLGDISLEIDARRDPVRLRADLWRGGHRIRLSPRGIQIDGENVTGVGIQNLGLVAMGIDLHTDEGRVTLSPDARFGSGVLVSQPTFTDRLVESVAAFNRLKSGNPSAIEQPRPNPGG